LAPFKDFMKKVKEAAEKGLEMAKEAIAIEALMRDFDEKVASMIARILVDKGYRVIGQREVGDYYELRVAVDDLEKVKPIIDRDMMKRYSPKDREKIIQVIPDVLEIRVYYASKMKAPQTIFPSSAPDDTRVEAYLTYYVERRGGFFSKVKRDEHRIHLGSFSFRSSDFVDADEHRIDEEKLRSYLEEKLRIFGLF